MAMKTKHWAIQNKDTHEFFHTNNSKLIRLFSSFEQAETYRTKVLEIWIEDDERIDDYETVQVVILRRIA